VVLGEEARVGEESLAEVRLLLLLLVAGGYRGQSGCRQVEHACQCLLIIKIAEFHSCLSKSVCVCVLRFVFVPCI